jgi:hypothetical protein
LNAFPFAKRLVLVTALAVAIVTGSFTPSSAFLDKTRFVLHLGVAYFAFHHWVVKPYQEGAFASGAPHRISSIVKGGVALFFAYHEVKVAEKIARTSKDPLLQKLDGGLTNLETTFASTGQKFKSGDFNPADIVALTSAAGFVKGQASSEGVAIKDVPPPAPVPGL